MTNIAVNHLFTNGTEGWVNRQLDTNWRFPAADHPLVWSATLDTTHVSGTWSTGTALRSTSHHAPMVRCLPTDGCFKPFHVLRTPAESPQVGMSYVHKGSGFKYLGDATKTEKWHLDIHLQRFDRGGLPADTGCGKAVGSCHDFTAARTTICVQWCCPKAARKRPDLFPGGIMEFDNSFAAIDFSGPSMGQVHITSDFWISPYWYGGDTGSGPGPKIFDPAGERIYITISVDTVAYTSDGYPISFLHTLFDGTTSCMDLNNGFIFGDQAGNGMGWGVRFGVAPDWSLEQTGYETIDNPTGGRGSGTGEGGTGPFGTGDCSEVFCADIDCIYACGLGFCRSKGKCEPQAWSGKNSGWPLVPVGLCNPTSRIGVVADDSGPDCYADLPALAVDYSSSGAEGVTFLGEGGGHPGMVDDVPGLLDADRSNTGWLIENDSCWRTRFWAKSVPDPWSGYVLNDGIDELGLQVRVGFLPFLGPTIYVDLGPDMTGHVLYPHPDRWYEFDACWCWPPEASGIPPIPNSPLCILSTNPQHFIDCSGGQFPFRNLYQAKGRILLKAVSTVPCETSTGVILRKQKHIS